MDLLDATEIPRREMVLIFVADTSGSMSGNKIQSVNQAVKEVIPMLDEISNTNPDAKIKIAALSFSSGVKWMYDQPKNASEFVWQDLQSGGLTDFGAACEELNTKLSRREFMQSDTGGFAPVVLLMSDGEPTDNYEKSISELSENKWFKNAIKIAIAIGDDVNTDVLKEFTGSIESVVEVHNIEALKKIIRLASVTASTIGSQSSTAGDKSKQQLVEDSIVAGVSSTHGATSAAAPGSISYDDDWE